MRSISVFSLGALVPFTLYLRTLAPGVTPEDSGELITAAYTLGVAHPPGYPLWCLIAKGFTLLPFEAMLSTGDVAWRVNLCSAVTGSLACGVLALLSLRASWLLSRTPRETQSTSEAWIAIGTAWLFGASRDFWSQCVIAEVYALNVLQILLLLYFAIQFVGTRRSCPLYLFALNAGLGLGSHSTMIPVSLVCTLWMFLACASTRSNAKHRSVATRRPDHSNLSRIGIALLFGLAGSSVLLYLPIRSLANPVLDWGNPETVPATLRHLLRHAYREPASLSPETPRELGHQLRLVVAFIETAFAQWTAWVTSLLLMGLLSVGLRSRRLAALQLSIYVLTSYGFIWLLNSPVDREHLHLNRVFFLPAHAIAAWSFGEALSQAARCWKSQGRKVAAMSVTVCAILLWLMPCVVHFERNDRSQDRLAEHWGRAMLESAPQDAVLVTASDHTTFPLLYLQVVEGVRPDLRLANPYGALAQTDIEALCVESLPRRVLFTSRALARERDGYELRPHGLYFESVRVDTTAATPAERQGLWARARLPRESAERRPGELGSDFMLGHYYSALARAEFAAGNRRQALVFAELVGRYVKNLPAALNNLGSLLARAGEYFEAERYFLLAHAVQPKHRSSTINLALLYHQLGQHRKGYSWICAAAELSPTDDTLRLARARALRLREKTEWTPPRRRIAPGQRGLEPAAATETESLRPP